MQRHPNPLLELRMPTMRTCEVAFAAFAAGVLWCNGEVHAQSPARAESSTDMKLFQADPRLERILKRATDSEITGGVAANILMPLLLHIDGTAVRIDKDVVSAINVMFGRPEDHIDAPGFGRPPGSLDTLKNFAQLEWPMHLRGAQQETLTKLLPAVVLEAANGALEYERYLDAK